MIELGWSATSSVLKERDKSCFCFNWFDWDYWQIWNALRLLFFSNDIVHAHWYALIHLIHTVHVQLYIHPFPLRASSPLGPFILWCVYMIHGSPLGVSTPPVSMAPFYLGSSRSLRYVRYAFSSCQIDVCILYSFIESFSVATLLGGRNNWCWD